MTAKIGSTRTLPVKFCCGPCDEGCEPARTMVCSCADAALCAPTTPAEARAMSSVKVVANGVGFIGKTPSCWGVEPETAATVHSAVITSHRPMLMPR